MGQIACELVPGFADGTIWFTPDMELSGVFAGSLAVALGLGFQLGPVAIIVGTVIGAVPAAILWTWGAAGQGRGVGRTYSGPIRTNRSRHGRALLYTCLLKSCNFGICFPPRMGGGGVFSADGGSSAR